MTVRGSGSAILRYWQNYCQNTSVHGVRYLGLPELSWAERLIWTFVMVVALTGIVNVSFLISVKYQTSPLSTVVESTSYHVSEISYPAITVCNNHRVDFERIAEAMERFIPNSSAETQETFLRLLKAFEIVDFGSFDEFEDILSRDLDSLSSLRLADVAEFMRFSCADLFIRCWWRNKYVSCCETLFTLQKTEYGICYSFNSYSSAPSPGVNRSHAWPWRASSFNEWSGLRIEFRVKQSIYFNESRPLGMLFIVHNPFEWPNTARFIPAGTTTSVRISATSFYASQDVRSLPVQERQCIYQDETLSAASDIMFMRGLPYLRPNCIAECRQRHTFKYCNCTVDFFYPDSGAYPGCNIFDLVCLNKYNDIFNYEVPPVKNEFFNEEEIGMHCPCLTECVRILYQTEVQPNLAMSTKTNDSVTLDFHFGSGEMVRYRTDITFGWLDLMVAFGGVAGLFLGCSLLSGVEMIYYLTIGLFYQAKRSAKSAKFNSRGQQDGQLQRQAGHGASLRVDDDDGAIRQGSRVLPVHYKVSPGAASIAPSSVGDTEAPEPTIKVSHGFTEPFWSRFRSNRNSPGNGFDGGAAAVAAAAGSIGGQTQQPLRRRRRRPGRLANRLWTFAFGNEHNSDATVAESLPKLPPNSQLQREEAKQRRDRQGPKNRFANWNANYGAAGEAGEKGEGQPQQRVFYNRLDWNYHNWLLTQKERF